MDDIFVFLAGAFLLGIARSASTCAIICAPGLMPYIIVKKLSLRESVKLGIIFNVPRIILLTALGAAVGALMATAGSGLDLRGFARPLGITGYLLMGAILIAGGGYVLWKGTQKGAQKNRGSDIGDIKDRTDTPCENRGKDGGKEEKSGTFFTRRIQKAMSETVENGSLLFFALGGLLSIACLGELAIIEGAVITGLAVGSSGAAIPALVGATTMFVFALGATLPVVIAAAVGGGVARRVRATKAVEKIRDFAAVLLILIGLVLVIAEVLAILKLLLA
jgi:hypothetical protein